MQPQEATMLKIYCLVLWIHLQQEWHCHKTYGFIHGTASIDEKQICCKNMIRENNNDMFFDDGEFSSRGVLSLSMRGEVTNISNI